MSGQLEGIGAVLREDDGFIKVVRIIPGSASWRQGKLAAEDIILKVAQEKGDAISIIETPVRDAVKLIRGPKGSNVILTIKKPDGIIETISITRDIVVIKSTYAKTGVFNVNNKTFGYIALPSFYRDFENTNNRNAATDIKQALKELTNTSGLILDLRNNGGGSLRDAVDISGYFISSGPIVQVSNNNMSKNAFFDLDEKIHYSKPLIVLVNTFSASASEIVAAALQDYDRAIIIGNKHTFGKGTVQKVIDLNQVVFYNTDPLGYLKITIQEYFRINGTSTQFKGITPDIILPSKFDYIDIGEKELKYALKGSQITPRQYNKWQPNYDKNVILKRSLNRQHNNEINQKLSSFNQFMKEKQNNSLKSINILDMWREIKSIEQQNQQINDYKTIPNFTSFNTIIPNIATLNDESEKEELTKWSESLNNDYMINEAISVLLDINNRDLY